MMERAAAGRRSPTMPDYNMSTSTLAFDQNFTTTPKGILLLAEIVFGMLVWILVGGTEYFHLPALCWVMFVSILCWILTICLFIIYLTGSHNRLPQVPWTTLSLCFHSGAMVLYLVAAVVAALSVHQAVRGRHNYNCWAASTQEPSVSKEQAASQFFAFLTTLCYAGSSCLSCREWKTTEEQQ